MSLRKFFVFIFLCFTSLSLTAAEGDAPLYVGIDADFSAVAIEGGFAIKHGAEIAAEEILEPSTWSKCQDFFPSIHSGKKQPLALVYLSGPR